MNIIYKISANNLICLFIGGIFILINFIYLIHYPLPWIDEVMFTDTSANWALSGEWTSHAWYAGGNQEPFSTYPPLYQFTMGAWIKIFGFSIEACRSLNLFIALVLSFTISDFLQKQNILQNYYSVILFCLLFWTGNTFSWIYKNGRVDILNALCTIIFFIQAYYYIFKNGKIRNAIITAFFLFLSGIQGCVFIIATIIYSWLFLKQYRKRILYLFYWFIIGTFTGLILLSIFMYLHHHLFAFFVSLVSYSATLKSVAGRLLPVFGEQFGLDVNTWLAKLNDNTSVSFLTRLIESISYSYEYIFITLLNIILAIVAQVKKTELRKVGLFILGLSIFIPLFLNIAGRFAEYYSWMCYLPAIATTIIYIDRTKSLIFKGIYLFITIVVMYNGLFRNLIYDNKNKEYANIKSFIQEADFTPKDKIVSTFSCFYEIRKINDNCYFGGIYPSRFMPNSINYIIYAKEDYGSLQISNYIKEKKGKGYKVIKIKEIQEPSLTLYKIDN